VQTNITNTPTRKSSPNGVPYLKIGDVARLVKISPSMLRTWERAGLAKPQRSEGSYRLYTPEDVRILKRARYLRRVRGLNAPAIVELLQQEGALQNGKSREAGRDIQVGKHLRRLRLKSGRSLASVAKSCGVSVGFLSALERSHMSASVGTLRRIAKFYHVNILNFFGPGAPKPVVRANERKRLEAGRGVRMELLAWGDVMMEPHLFRIAPGAGSGESYSHEGEEFIFVLRGQMTISLEGREYLLRRGDSFYFQSKTEHRWTNPGKSETHLLWINTPPTF
jgi:DNA-binding transcriptional MerR regulator/mannose-6-phosphate isomerase-like protein (cupin superfamily)